MSIETPTKFLTFAAFYALFIIYGSLLPFDFQAKSLYSVWTSFKNIQYLNLGAGSRADWVANIILYIPFTFSLAAYFTFYNKTYFQTFVITCFIFITSILLAISIEFIQHFFPPRTVSINDLIAETIGSIIGISLWFGYRKQSKKLYQLFLSGGRGGLIASMILYTAGYLFISFFPYDFVTSFQELEDKIAGGHDALWISSSCHGIIACTTKLVTEVILVIPIGILLGIALKMHPARRTAVIILGILLGIFIESIQLFLINGMAQGVSVFTRALGIGLGDLLYSKANQFKILILVRKYKRLLLLLIFPYLLLLIKLNGWSLSTHQSMSVIMEKIDNVDWIPFYYHYFTSESVAMSSLLFVFVLYFPVGVFIWVLGCNEHGKTSGIVKMVAGLLATSLCLVMEAGKLLFSAKHADPTNLIISFASAYFAISVINTMSLWRQQD